MYCSLVAKPTYFLLGDVEPLLFGDVGSLLFGDVQFHLYIVVRRANLHICLNLASFDIVFLSLPSMHVWHPYNDIQMGVVRRDGGYCGFFDFIKIAKW